MLQGVQIFLRVIPKFSTAQAKKKKKRHTFREFRENEKSTYTHSFEESMKEYRFWWFFRKRVYSRILTKRESTLFFMLQKSTILLKRVYVWTLFDDGFPSNVVGRNKYGFSSFDPTNSSRTLRINSMYLSFLPACCHSFGVLIQDELLFRESLQNLLLTMTRCPAPRAVFN